jgi:hypothetical protein
VEITAWELTPRGKADFMLVIYSFFADITNAGNSQVAWLWNFGERNLDWKKFKYTQ